jgi:hypothetical protein
VPFSPEDLAGAFHGVALDVLEKAVPPALAALGAAQAATAAAEAAVQRERRHGLALEKKHAAALFAAQQADRAVTEAIHQDPDADPTELEAAAAAAHQHAARLRAAAEDSQTRRTALRERDLAVALVNEQQASLAWALAAAGPPIKSFLIAFEQLAQVDGNVKAEFDKDSLVARHSQFCLDIAHKIFLLEQESDRLNVILIEKGWN